MTFSAECSHFVVTVKQFNDTVDNEENEQVGTEDNPIHWEPVCPAEERDYADDAATISKLLKSIDFDVDFLFPVLGMKWKFVATWIIEPPVQLPCHAIKYTLDDYLQGTYGGHHQYVAAEALVFYRRHSPWLKPHLTDTQIAFLENMCCVLRALLRSAGWSVRCNGHTFP